MANSGKWVQTVAYDCTRAPASAMQENYLPPSEAWGLNEVPNGIPQKAINVTGQLGVFDRVFGGTAGGGLEVGGTLTYVFAPGPQ